ncbi:reverse transcriptase [Gossypium australe]|uniref:Reverse transcriptase n=1 Tax=Gossypium australe TaxID=47621 RepID=A0A5B6V4J8_9ROSI|nr:reverse transcriptase [Gossypium australe]
MKNFPTLRVLPQQTPKHNQICTPKGRMSPSGLSIRLIPQYRCTFQLARVSNPGDGLANPMVPDLDELAETDKARVDLPRQLEDRCKWLEEKFREMETADHHYRVGAKDLSLVSDLVLPPKFKIPDFEKYNGTSCPKAHITMFYRQMDGHVNNDQLLIYCFQDSLVGSATRWYNQLSRAQIKTWKDLAQAFMKQYGHVADIAPDRIMLQNMEKKSSESFKQYGQRWREVAMQVQPPLLEKETTMLFINILKAPFITHMIGSTTKSFADIVMVGEMIENAIRGGKIEVGENTKRATPRKKDSEVNNMSTYNKGYSKTITVSQPKVVTARQQGLIRQESGTRQNSEKIQFTPIPVTYKDLYQTLFNEHIVSPFYLQPFQPPYPKWYDSNAHCDYHAGIVGHSIENCTAFKKVVDRPIKMGVVKLDYTPSAENPLPNHEDLVQSLMDNKELEFYEEGLERGNIHVIEGELTKQEVNYPRIIISRPRNTEGGAQVVPKVVIQKPISFPYKDNKRVPWNYNCNVTISGVESSVSTSEEVQNEGFYTRSGKRYDLGNVRVEPVKSKTMAVEREKGPGALINEPVKEKEAKEFLKFLKHSEYSVVEQLRKQPARISVLALLLSLEVHHEALMKVLNETYVTKDISVNKLDRLTLSSVLIDNGSALNVLPLSTLKRIPVGYSHMKACQNIVREFDGTERRVMGRMYVPLLIGPNTYEVDFLVMDIKPSYNCLLGRPWIHPARAVPSSLHQKLKLVTENRLVTINAEEDIIATVTNEAPYLETNDETIECSFRSLEFVNATFILEGNEVPVPKMSKTTRMGLQMMVGKGALPGKRLGIHLQGGVQVSILKEKRDRFGLGFKPDSKQMKKEIEKKQERRRARLNGEDIKWESMTFPHISQTFLLGGIIHLERGISKNENPHINAIHDEEVEQENLLGIHPYEPRSVLDNWTVEEFPVVFRDYTESLDINDMSNDTTDPKVYFEQDMCLKEFQDFEEEVENIALGEGKVVKIGTRIAEETKQDLELLWEFNDVFAWSYQDMPGLSTDIVVHRLPIREECKPVQQKLRRMRPDVVLKIKEEVKKQFDAGFLQVVKYSEWVTNIVPVPKKDGKVQRCVDYKNLNKASPKDNFPLPHIDTLVHNTAGYPLFSFMDGFSKYNQIRMHPEDMEKTIFITLRGTFCYKVMPFGLKNVGETYQRAMVTLFHDIMHKEIELTEKCDPIFRLLKKHNQSVWDDECQKAFDKVKQYLSNAPVLSPPNLDRPLILYLSVFDNSMGCVLGQHDESGRKEKTIYYLSKKFTECEMRYSLIEKLCCALVWTTRRLRRYMLYHTTWLISKLDSLKYMIESTALNGRMARWQILLSEFDIVYVNQKAIKGSAIAEFLASRALEDYEPLSFDFPNEDLIYVANTEECSWKLNFDGASNAVGNGIGAILVSPNGDHYPFTCKLDFDCTNNMAEYEACIMGIRAAIERKIRVLEVYGDSALVIYQLKGEWETRDSKLLDYRKIVLGLIEEFDHITFNYLPRDENQMADALATLASMIKVNRPEDIRPIQMSILEVPTHCYNVEEEERNDYPWYHDVLRYIKNREYPEHTTENEKRTLRRLASDYVLDGDILYKKRKDQVLLRCVDAVEARKILEEVHEGVCGTHANGFTMARQIMRFGYYWSTMEGDCISYAKRCHKCQIHGDKIKEPPSPLHVMTSPWPFSMWGMDVIGPISPKASNGHRLIFVVIDYFTKWVEAASYASVTKSAVMEAANKSIKKIVGKMTETYRDWHEKLPFALYAYRTSVRTSTGATPFSLVYGMEAVLPIEVEIPSLRVLSKIKLDEAEWIQAQYDQLNLIEEKRLRAIRHGPYVLKKAFSGGALILAEMDGKNLSNLINSDSVKKLKIAGLAFLMLEEQIEDSKSGILDEQIEDSKSGIPDVAGADRR